MHEVRHDLGWAVASAARRCRHERREQSEEGRVGVDVVEGSAVVDLWVVVQDVSV